MDGAFDGGAAKLEQFCTLAKSARNKAAVALVKQVLSNKIYVFGELLEMPNIAEVRSTHPRLYITALPSPISAMWVLLTGYVYSIAWFGCCSLLMAKTRHIMICFPSSRMVHMPSTKVGPC